LQEIRISAEKNLKAVVSWITHIMQQNNLSQVLLQTSFLISAGDSSSTDRKGKFMFEFCVRVQFLELVYFVCREHCVKPI